MILFLLNTPTQLLNAMAIAGQIETGEVCDAYYTENLSSFFESSKIGTVFSNNYCIQLIPDLMERRGIIKKSVVRIKNALDFQKVKKNLPSDPKQYSRVYASGISLRNYEIYYAIKSLNPAVSLSLFEEGMCEYYNLGKKKSIAQILFSYFFFGHYYMKEADSVYLYTPDAAIINWSNIVPKKIPYIEERGLIELINDVFHYEQSDLHSLKNKVIILEQAFYEESQISGQNSVIELIEEIVGANQIVVKLHPRSNIDKYGDRFRCSTCRIPLEIISLNEDILNNTFVSISSSSVLNFKLMLGKEPDVIVLNRLDRSTMMITDLLFDYVRDHCSKHNFYIPKDMAELKEVVQLIAEKKKA